MLWTNSKNLVYNLQELNLKKLEKLAKETDYNRVKRIAVKSPNTTVSTIRAALMRKGTVISKRTLRPHLCVELD